jgi:hypothetical protein
MSDDNNFSPPPPNNVSPGPDKDSGYTDDFEKYRDYIERMENAPASAAPALAFSHVMSSRKQKTQEQEEEEERRRQLEVDKRAQHLFNANYGDQQRNQHGHVLLPFYRPSQEAAGLGAGSRHRDHFRYLSHYKASNDAVASEPRKSSKSKKKSKEETYFRKGGRYGVAAGMGFGANHRQYNGYMAATRVDDLPVHTRPLNMQMLNAI